MSPRDQIKNGRHKDPQRSRCYNGGLLPRIVDGRSPWVRRVKDAIADHLSDLGGEEHASVAERSLVRRAAVLTAELERLEVRFALAGADEVRADDLELYQRGTNTLRRALESLGLRRRPKDITPTLDQYLRRRQADDADSVEASG
jgi:hypothetical protein